MLPTPHQHPILLYPRLAEGEIRLPIRDAPPHHRLPPKYADLTGWYISEDGTELVLYDGPVEAEEPFVDMVRSLDGLLPDLHLFSYDEDQNITYSLTRRIITEVECRAGKGRVTATPIQDFIADARYLNIRHSQDWNPRIRLLLELCTRPTMRTPELVKWTSVDVAHEVDQTLDIMPAAIVIADLFSTGRLLHFLNQLESVGGDAAVTARLRARVETRHRGATAKLLDALLAIRPAAPDRQAPLVSRHLGPDSALEQVLATLGPGTFPKDIDLWPALRVETWEPTADAGPAELLPIGMYADSLLFLDTRYRPAQVLAQAEEDPGRLIRVGDDLLDLLAFSVGSALWNG
jgi:hypothetical protein